jgi:hypothetical protein
MGVLAFEILAGISEQQRPRRHQLRTPAGAQVGRVLKGPCHDDCDCHRRVLLFERMVLWTARADHIFDDPSVTMSQEPARWTARAPINDALRQRLLDINRNFCQEPASRYVVQRF